MTEQEIAALLTMPGVIDAVELAFKEHAAGYTEMPPKSYLNYVKYSGDLRTMPAYLERLGVSAVKIVTAHPENPKKFGLPTVRATILLIDPKDGHLKAIVGGTNITAFRTGAAGALAAKYLARKDSKTVGFVGAGVQARMQLSALCTIFSGISTVKIWDLAPDAAKKFTEEINAKAEGLNAVAVKTAKEAVADVDVVVTTTPSKAPIILDSWVSEGTHFNCIGADAPGKEELEPTILKRAKVVVDDWVQASHSGEINVPIRKGTLTREDVWAELGEIIAGTKLGRLSPEEITIFDSTGLAIQDAVTADLAYKEAIRRKIGHFITL